jgi:hypothetical protein
MNGEYASACNHTHVTRRCYHTVVVIIRPSDDVLYAAPPTNKCMLLLRQRPQEQEDTSIYRCIDLEKQAGISKGYENVLTRGTARHFSYNSNCKPFPYVWERSGLSSLVSTFMSVFSCGLCFLNPPPPCLLSVG